MPEITIELSDSVLDGYAQRAQEERRSAADVIRETLEVHVPRRPEARHSVLDIEPVSVGRVLNPLTADDDLLEEMHP